MRYRALNLPLWPRHFFLVDTRRALRLINFDTVNDETCVRGARVLDEELRLRSLLLAVSVGCLELPSK